MLYRYMETALEQLPAISEECSSAEFGEKLEPNLDYFVRIEIDEVLKESPQEVPATPILYKHNGY